MQLSWTTNWYLPILHVPIPSLKRPCKILIKTHKNCSRARSLQCWSSMFNALWVEHVVFSIGRGYPCPSPPYPPSPLRPPPQKNKNYKKSRTKTFQIPSAASALHRMLRFWMHARILVPGPWSLVRSNGRSRILRAGPSMVDGYRQHTFLSNFQKKKKMCGIEKNLVSWFCNPLGPALCGIHYWLLVQAIVVSVSILVLLFTLLTVVLWRF